jgi:hypothetical protein
MTLAVSTAHSILPYPFLSAFIRGKILALPHHRIVPAGVRFRRDESKFF